MFSTDKTINPLCSCKFVWCDKILSRRNSSYCRNDFWNGNNSKVYKILVQEICNCVKIATQFGVAIDMPAGPSELLIVADDTAVPAFVASDYI
jgi:hypothetical protein